MLRLKNNLSRWTMREMFVKYMKLSRWTYIFWYQYLFERPFSFTKLVCRYKGHPHGEIFFNPGGMEPDHHCKDYLDDLG